MKKFRKNFGLSQNRELNLENPKTPGDISLGKIGTSLGDGT